MLGQIVILSGAPRSGRSSIAAAIQDGFDGIWLNLGVDVFGRALPHRLRPGIGLRPGGERPDLEDTLPTLYAVLYEAIAAHSRLGLNVVADVGHHEGHGRRLGILPDCARRLTGLPALLVGVRCPFETVMARRRASGGDCVRGTDDDPVPEPVRAWQHLVHAHGIYDVEVDTSVSSPDACAALIARALRGGLPRPSSWRREEPGRRAVPETIWRGSYLNGHDGPGTDPCCDCFEYCVRCGCVAYVSRAGEYAHDHASFRQRDRRPTALLG